MMVLRALGVDVDNLSPESIDTLIEQKTPESQYLEFKSELPTNQESARREFALDVTAMANGGGGVLMLGVLDENDMPVKVTPVPLGPEVTRLQQICATSIEPYLAVGFHEVPIQAGHGVIVVDIPASSRRPFVTVEGARFSSYIRVGRHKHPLTEAEIERLYRDRFRRQSDIAARLDELSHRASQSFVDDAHPRAYIAAVPEVNGERLFHPTRQVTNALTSLRVPPVFYTPSISTIPRQSRPGFKRLELAQDFAADALDEIGWVEIHDDGAFLGAITGDTRARFEGDVPRPLFYDTRFAAELLTGLLGFWTLAEHFGLRGEVRLRAGITPNRLPVELIAPLTRGSVYTAHALTEAVTTEFSADIADLTPGARLLQTGKVLLDDLFTAFGWPECLQISISGELRRRYFGQDWLAHVTQWANNNAVSLVDDTAT